MIKLGKKKKRKTSKSKIRIFISLIVFCSVIAALGYDCLNNILKIEKMKEEKINLQNQLVSLQEEQVLFSMPSLPIKAFVSVFQSLQL